MYSAQRWSFHTQTYNGTHGETAIPSNRPVAPAGLSPVSITLPASSSRCATAAGKKCLVNGLVRPCFFVVSACDALSSSRTGEYAPSICTIAPLPLLLRVRIRDVFVRKVLVSHERVKSRKRENLYHENETFRKHHSSAAKAGRSLHHTELPQRHLRRLCRGPQV